MVKPLFLNDVYLEQTKQYKFEEKMATNVLPATGGSVCIFSLTLCG